MKSILAPVFCFLIIASCNNFAPKELPIDNRISIGIVDSVESQILGENRKVWVHVPNSLPGSVPSQAKYPVLYLLDGDGHFYSVMGLMKQLSTTNGNTLLPEMIIVGIPNTDRTRDLTPTKVADMFPTSGGGEEFTEFIAEELIPFIDRKYPTTSHRTLIGHSFGGLMVVNTLIHHPELFDNYLAIDPSMWWDQRKLLNQTKKILPNRNYSNKSLYVGIANTMGPDLDTLSVQSDTSGMTDHIRSIIEFSKFTQANLQNGLSFDWDYFQDDSHGSVPLISEHHGLRFLFDWYDFKDAGQLFQPDSLLSTEEATSMILSHFDQVSEKFGYNVAPTESLINEFGYAFMGRANEKAKAFLQMNIENYPTSANAFDSMGDYYLALNDTVNAIKHFEKAVELGKLPYSIQKLEDITTKK